MIFGRNGIPAHIFNHVVDTFLRGLPFPGARILVSQVHGGWLVSLDSGGGWRHPWFTTATWSEDRWECHVQPGFVNGMDPLVSGVGPKGEDLGLADDPRIPLHGFRALGNDEGDEAPVFFQNLGVRANQQRVEAGADGIVFDATDREETFKLPQRFLRACDVVITIARASLVGSVEIVDETGSSGQVALYRVGMDISALERFGHRARLFVTSQYEEPRKPTLEERLLGLYSDPTEDARHISTIYLLSPPGIGGEPDGSWTPFIQHRTFWNLKYAARNALPKEPPVPIRLFTGLLSGLGDEIGNKILSQVNEFADRVSNALNNTSNEGKFWTV